ncbi:hypothetical protein NQ318_018511 [Aromia moschata]|uniref:Uncharacterized protein n=1 Tax=Aromia moschata TaxID=1265417 RepID=A0AAV8ZH17_9CUCU|nr:hypothetical protein NQ318_018511 [Aromia moschata]
MSIDDKTRSGSPSTARNDENVEKLRELVLTDHRQTIDQLSEFSGLSWSSVQRILTEYLRMKRVAGKFVPRALTDNQKECRLETYLALKQQLETDPDELIDFLSKVIIVDRRQTCLEADVYGNNAVEEITLQHRYRGTILCP